MIQTIKKNIALLISAVVIALAAGLVAAPAMTSAQDIQDNLCGGAQGLSITGGDDCTATEEANDDVNTLITNIVNIFSIVVGIIAVIMIIVGGFKYITSSGDSGNVTSAKNTIMYAIIGLIIVALAQIIVRFVLNASVNAA